MNDVTDARPSDEWPDGVTLGEVIRRRRRRLGLNQTQVGVVFGVDQSTVARWERGDRISPERLEKVAQWLELPMELVMRLNFLADRERDAGFAGGDDESTLTAWLAAAVTAAASTDEGQQALLAAVASASAVLADWADEANPVLSRFCLADLEEVIEHLAAAHLLGLGANVTNRLVEADHASHFHLEWWLELRREPLSR